jgi:hypothetical protein
MGPRSLIIFLFGMSMGAGMLSILLPPPTAPAGSGQAGATVDQVVVALREDSARKDAEIARLRALAGACESNQAARQPSSTQAPVAVP